MRSSLERPTTIVGHLAPDLDCITAIWLIVRFWPAEDADILFVPAGTTLNNQPPDSDPQILHVDTGMGRFDHHHIVSTDICAAELIRQELIPDDPAIQRMIRQVCQIDHAIAPANEHGFFNINALIAGYNLLFPNRPHHVAYAMFPNIDAWYEHEARQFRFEQAFARRLEFETPWGLGIAMESKDGASSKLAYGHGAVLYAYRDGHGWMGIAAKSHSNVDLSFVYYDLQIIDQGADWYLHPNKRLLLCGSAKSPPRTPSRLTLDELVRVIQGEKVFQHSLKQ